MVFFKVVPTCFMEKTRVPRENHQPAVSHWQLYHIMLYQVHLAWAGFELTTLVMIGTDCIGSYKSNYHMITNHDGPVTLKKSILNLNSQMKIENYKWIVYSIYETSIFYKLSCRINTIVLRKYWKMRQTDKIDMSKLITPLYFWNIINLMVTVFPGNDREFWFQLNTRSIVSKQF